MKFIFFLPSILSSPGAFYPYQEQSVFSLGHQDKESLLQSTNVDAMLSCDFASTTAISQHKQTEKLRRIVSEGLQRPINLISLSLPHVIFSRSHAIEWLTGKVDNGLNKCFSSKPRGLCSVYCCHNLWGGGVLFVWRELVERQNQQVGQGENKDVRQIFWNCPSKCLHINLLATFSFLSTTSSFVSSLPPQKNTQHFRHNSSHEAGSRDQSAQHCSLCNEDKMNNSFLREGVQERQLVLGIISREIRELTLMHSRSQP